MKRRQEANEVTRRGVLTTGASLAVSSVFGCPESTSAGPSSDPKSVYEAIGVKHVINATGTVTTLVGSLMPPEVIAAWSDAAKHFVDLFDLQDKVGARIAKRIGVEAGSRHAAKRTPVAHDIVANT
jgi:L-seryl-tRNA(Ser) seleniumtransferase